MADDDPEIEERLKRINSVKPTGRKGVNPWAIGGVCATGGLLLGAYIVAVAPNLHEATAPPKTSTSAEFEGGDITFVLPADRKLIGNPTLPAIHGGVVGAFMEQAAALHLVARMDDPVLPRIINFSLDYLRPARLRDTFARCVLTRQGRQIANVSITAWQENSEEPVAIARAHFLVPGSD